MPAKQEVITKFNLITGESTYAGQAAQDPATARRLQSLIPSLKGELIREAGEAKYLPTLIGGGAKVGELVQYDYNDTNGNQQTKRFAATATQLYMEVAGAWVAQSIINPATGLNTSTPFAGYPTFKIINNLLHFSDGVNNWLYDGPNSAFVQDGFPIPTTTIGIVGTSAGAITAGIGKFYWFTFADETVGRVHESSSSPISASTGPLTSKQVSLSLSADMINTTSGSAAVTSVGAAFTPAMVGLALHIGGAFSGLYGTIIAFVNSSTMTLSVPAFATNAAVGYILTPPRATAIHVYCSESDGSKLGKFLFSIVNLNSLGGIDNSPFQNQPGSSITNIDRPIRNDPPPPSSVIEPHKYRLFRRRETIPNRFTYTANEEVLAGTNGSPQESVPGTDPKTLSDIIDETAYPKPALAIRALKSHMDALYIGTEKEIIPLWGDSIDSFALSQVTAIDGGVISRWGMESTSHGLVVFSYDRKLYLYPPISPIYALTPEDINVTDQLTELGIAMRTKFLTIKASDIQNVRVVKYKYNLRDWLVICYQDTLSVYHTYVYDFETKGWVELQQGFVSAAVFETSPGVKILVGGGTDGFVYVVDDPTGAITPNATLPTAIFRTSLIDFGHPDILHIPKYLEVEVSNAALMDSSTTVNFYLDPKDADNLPTPITLTMFPVPGESTRYRGWFAASEGGQGVVCRRLMVEFKLASDTNAGSFRGIVLKADPVSGMMR